MADPNKPTKSKFIFIFYKFFIIIFAILVFSYFPSQVPEYFKQTTIVSKLWDLIYLLVIGIVVCYGLFSRKIDSSTSECDSVGGKESFISGISDISSIFEDGVRGNYGFDEKYVVQGLGRLEKVRGYKALGLPVRSLGWKSVDSGGGKVVSEDVSSDWDEMKKGKFRGLVPIKLEDKFRESEFDDWRVLSWRSKSMRLEKREGMCVGEGNGTTDFGGDEVVDFEGLKLKSQSMRLPMPSQSRNGKELIGIEVNEGYRKPSFKESKPQKFGVGASSEMNGRLSSKEVFNDFGKIKIDDVTLDGSSKVYRKDFGSRIDEDKLDLSSNTPFTKSKNQRSSVAASSEMNDRLSLNGILKDFGNINKLKDGTLDDRSKEFWKVIDKTEIHNGNLDSNHYSDCFKSNGQQSRVGASSEMNLEAFNYVSGKKERANSLKSIPKPAPIVNTYKRGKSVRTNRPRELVLEANVKSIPRPTDYEDETRSKLGTDATDVNLDQNLSDTEPHFSEVDRKADEFIAKFREQIRLQRVASARKLNLL